MNKLLICSMFSLALMACASSNPYRAAEGKGYGYHETQLSDQQYRVGFKKRGQEHGAASDYALLRAAELTLENGYDWFEVVDRQSEVIRDRNSTRSGVSASQSRTLERDCGLLHCETRMGSPRTQYGIGMEFGADRSKTEVVLEIRMDKGVRPNVARAYSAQEIANNLRAQLFK